MTMIVKLKIPRHDSITAGKSADNRADGGCGGGLGAEVQRVVVKPEPGNHSTVTKTVHNNKNNNRGGADRRVLNREPENADAPTRKRRLDNDEENHDKEGEAGRQGLTDRRLLRCKYLAVKNWINDEKDDISKVKSDKFKSIIGEVENLHKQVQKPREQVADAEALLDIANTLVMSIKLQNNDGVTPSDFVTSLLQGFGQQEGQSARSSIVWGDIGLDVLDVFMKAPGCPNMLGPMNSTLKQRKPVNRRRRNIPTGIAFPEELDNTDSKKTDTDNNMATMFDILKRKKSVKLKNLVLNRKSFAQTVENIFALSFLVKDGRVHINEHHLVSPRNAPGASAVLSGEVQYHHFFFRFDFQDWKKMINLVGEGEELMPHRDQKDVYNPSGASKHYPQAIPLTTPVKKFSRNQGLHINEHLVKKEFPEKDKCPLNALPGWHVKLKRSQNQKCKLGWV